MTNIKILGTTDGRYNLDDTLYFLVSSFTIDRDNDNEFNKFIKLEIDKKSALEIAYTLLDSVNLLTNEAEKLLYKIEDKIMEE